VNAQTPPSLAALQCAFRSDLRVSRVQLAPQGWGVSSRERAPRRAVCENYAKAETSYALQ